MLYFVSYLAYNCDDGIGERTGWYMDDFDAAMRSCADLSETEEGVTISFVTETVDEDDLPF